ncbi:MAG: hypothetical protein A2787_02530 [Omnitrophica WOR_2 bacterium RIFCSPHIGHO2_01_FULL_48_9]|nr:MAG: hypothetical protein A3D10_01720 [Omnitrophica WOR_2 bacterium RIFCSPHIGHO2_02_FULL_48_11]OGX32501.1 MAG: hypothetical protein A2787_02530 [Omnitrophica WOR_2 bacterium RIFCSPHIGHO2_01_FULL_48_9]
MKHPRLKSLSPNTSGVILMIVLWVLVILTVLVVGLGRKTSIDLALTKNRIGKFRSKYLAWGGLVYTIEQIRRDTEDPEAKAYDTLYECGIRLEKNQSPEDLFKKIPLGAGYFEVAYKSAGTKNILYGLQDEERRLNLNAINVQNYKIFYHLLTLLDVEDRLAETIAAAVADWQDTDNEVTNKPWGAEDDYYMGLAASFHVKNSLFDHVQELLLVRGVTPEIFNKIKNYITVFPKSGSMQINFETASEVVLRAVARGTAPLAGADIGDADNLARKMLRLRAGNDGKDGTGDDRSVEMNDLGLVATEQAIFLTMSNNRTKVAQFLRVTVTGVDQTTLVKSRLEAVVERSSLTVVFWQRH